MEITLKLEIVLIPLKLTMTHRASGVDQTKMKQCNFLTLIPRAWNVRMTPCLVRVDVYSPQFARSKDKIIIIVIVHNSFILTFTVKMKTKNQRRQQM